MHKILLSEGSSLTSRETLTALKDCGFCIDILSSSKFPSTAFSVWKHKLIATVNVNVQPQQYLEHVSRLLKSGEYTTIIPTHETAWLFAEGVHCLPSNVAIPVAKAESFQKVQSKIAFAQLADELRIPQPKWELLTSNPLISLPYPYWLKADFGTAGRSVYRVNDSLELHEGIKLLSTGANQLMAQESVDGQYGQVQAVFDHGRMIAVHTSMQRGVGAGGSAAARISVDYPETREHIRKIGCSLDWHGSLTLDFIYRDGIPYYIECNPRMIEPGNAAKAGVNFPEILIHLSSNENLATNVLIGESGVRTHSTLALLLGAAERGEGKRGLLKLFWQGITCTGDFQDSVEVLTPYKGDFPSIIPLFVILLQLLIAPHKVNKIAQRAIEDYCVLPETIKTVRL